MYRITVAENSMPTDGKFVEIVGNYNPTDLSQPLNIQKDRVEYWISKGAKPTNTVAKLLNKQGFSLPVEEYHKAPKKVAKPAETVATTPTAPATEKPIEEAPAPKAEEQPVPEVVVETTSEVEASTEEKDSGVAPEAPQNDGGEEAPAEETSEDNSDAGTGVANAKTE